MLPEPRNLSLPGGEDVNLFVEITFLREKTDFDLRTLLGKL
jgi:hypothetical protein